MNEQMIFICLLFKKYEKALKANKKFDEWCKDNPHSYSFEYDGETVPKAELKRLGIMLRQEMINCERENI